ncbi:MAG: filamentous hemagglutinin N-terminal domain-containing protein [Cyanobacteria bacterium P01_G01_bin.39]
MSKALSSLLRICFYTLGLSLANTQISLAQVTSDNTVNTQVNQNGNIAEITGGETRGANLFHSFGDFSVPTDNIADFQNADSISNIFSRVTGGKISNIDGMIRANGSANLFLINPAGIMLGENASLNIGGSFYGSSASSIVFENGEFSTDLNNPPLLTVNAPIGLGFRDNPGDITVQGNGNGQRLLDSEVIDTQDALRVDSDATIGLVGGELIFEDATVKTAGGRIEIGSVAEGTVNLTAVDNGFTFDYSNIKTFGDISLSEQSVIDASGVGGGNIQVAGKNITITEVSSFEANTLGNEPGGDINIFAQESLEISGVENELNSVSGIFSRTFPNGTADAGDINIETGSLSIGDRALINTGSLGQGNAGDININASESVTLASQGNTSGIFLGVDANAAGNSGNVEITSDSVSLDNGAFISGINSGQGSAGDVTINATENISLSNGSGIFVASSGGGSINLSANNLSLTSDSRFLAGIFSDLESAEAQGGDVVINLAEDLVIDNSFISNSILRGAGNLGDIKVNARNINFSNGGSITSFNAGEGDPSNIILTATEDITFDGIGSIAFSGIGNSFLDEAQGSIGEINITAQNLSLTNGGDISSLVGNDNNSGDINLNIADTILIEGFGTFTAEDGTQTEVSSSIFSSVRDGNGNSGDINLNSQNLILNNGGNISSANAGQGNSGGINIITQNLVLNDGNISSLNAGQGNAGDINFDVGSLSITEGGLISGDVRGEGNGGNIFINADNNISLVGNAQFFSVIRANVESDGTGEAGNIEINTPSLILDEGFIAADVEGQGNGGTIKINTASLIVDDGFISADILENAEGNGGTLEISASESIKLSNVGLIQASVLRGGLGNGGNLTIETKQLTLTEGSQISATTLGDGNAGTVTINAVESISLSGVKENGRSGILASALIEDGNGGDISLTTDQLTISDGAIISASNFSSLGEENGGAAPGTGEPGNIFITANSLNLESEGRIESITQGSTGTGANIDLDIANNIFLSGNSFISAQALGNANGGNLTIDTNVIVAFEGNNDMIASAEQGQGGNIDITAESLLGIKAGTLNPFTSDINASSEFGLDGSVALNIPDINSIQGETDLSVNMVETGETTAQACSADRTTIAQNRLVIRGKGGIPTAPEMPLSSTDIMVDDESNDTDSASKLPQPIDTSIGKIQPARGIKVTDKGGITLTAYRTNNQGNRLPNIKTSCG